MATQSYQHHLWRLFECLTSPTPSIQLEQQRQKIRIMSGLLLALLIAMIIIAPIWVVTSPGYSYAPLVSFGFVLVVSIAYGMSRTRFYMSGVLVLVLSIPLMTIITIFVAPGPITERMLALQMLVISPILAHSFLSQRTAVFTIVMNVGIISAFFFVPDVPFAFTFSYLVSLSVILALSAVSTTLAHNRYHTLFYQSHDAVFMLDLQGRHLEANRRAAEMMGYSVTELQSLSMKDLSAEIEQSEQILARVVKGEIIPQYERVFRKKDGSSISVEIDAELIRDVDGKPSHIQSVVQDISGRKQAEKALRDSQIKLTTVLENIPFRVFWKDQASVYGGCNTLHAHSNGLTSADEIIGKTDYDFLPERAAQWEADDREVMMSGQPKMHVEELITDATGVSCWLQSNKVAMRDGDGHVNGVLVTIEDVTERKRLENELRASEERLRLITDNIQDVVTRIDHEDRILYASDSARSVLGFAPEEIVGKSPQDFFHPDDWSQIDAAQRLSIEAGEPTMRGEQRMRHADGHYIDTETTGKFLYDDQGKFLGGIYATRDITRRKQLEAALRASEERLRLILDNMQDMLTRSDAQERIIYTSPSSRVLLGYQPEEMTGQFYHHFLPPEAHDRVVSARQQLIQNGLQHCVVEGHLRHADGHYVDVETVARFLYDNDGNYTGGIFVTRNITKRKQLETALRASEERLRLIMDNMQDLVILVNENQKIIYVSPSISSVMGYDTRNIVDTVPLDATHPDDRERVLQMIESSVASHLSTFTIEFRLRHIDGYYKNFEVLCRMLYDDHLNFSGAVFVARDITERKQFEAALLESEEKYRLIAENTSDGIFVFDAVAQRVVYVSPAYNRLMGREINQVLNASQSSLPDVIHPDDREQILSQFTDAITHKADHLITIYRSRRNDGQYFWREDHTSFNYAPDGTFLSTYVISRDITERKKMESLLVDQEKLKTNLEKEQELSTLKTHMMERIAHEFRTPLAVIQVASETLIHYYDRFTPERREEKGVTINDQIGRITHMLDEISMVIKGAGTLGHLGRVPTDLGNLCRKVAAELSTALNLPDKYIIDIPDNVLVSIDPPLIRDSLTHILRNAARYSEPADPVTVRLTQMEKKVELRIIDHGIGIPQDEVPHIFEPFFRGSNINERGGLGVGLTIARAAIEAHGGTITVESELGKGTTFITTISRQQTV